MLTKVIEDRKSITEFTRSISTTRIGYPVLMMDIKTNTADGLIEKTSSMLDEVASKIVHKDKEGD